MLNPQLHLAIREDGNLVLKANHETREEIGSLRDNSHWGDIDILIELTEHYWANGSYRPFDAGWGDPFVGLTSAPCIAECMDTLDDGTNEIVGRFWWYPDYQVRSPIDDLIETGECVFQLAGKA